MILINYADRRYRPAQRLNTWTGKYIAKFDKIYEFSPDDIDPKFKKEHAAIFSYKRGNGLWLWKSYLINKVISNSTDGDYIFYLDSGAFFIRSPRVLLDYITDDNPIFVTDIPLIESNWTKPECFNKLGGKDYMHTNQIQGGILFFKVNKQSRDFFNTYFKICSETNLLLPEGLGKEDTTKKDYGDTFVSHREDQSIFSLLCKQNGIIAHRDITQRWKDEFSFYNPHYAFLPVSHPNDRYPTIIYLHKFPSFTFRSVLGFLYSKTIYYLIKRRKLKIDYKRRLSNGKNMV